MQVIDERAFFWYSINMIKGRTPKIRIEEIKKIANKLVARTSDRFGRKPISSHEFKKIVEHANDDHISKLRSSRTTLGTHETKKFFQAFVKHVQEHPEYKLSGAARKVFNVRLHQGDNLIENFDPEKIGEKGLAFTAKAQAEEDAKLNTGPTPEEKLKAERRQRALQFLHVRETAVNREKEEKGLAGPPTSYSEIQAKQSTGSATSHKGAGTIAGATKVAGQSDTAKTSIPGQLNSNQPAKPSGPSSAPVHLAGGFSGLNRVNEAQKPTSIADESVAIPRIGISDRADNASQEPGKTADITSKFKSEKDQDKAKPDDKDDDLPDMDNVDKGLPLGS